MRLSAHEIDAIRDCARLHFGPDAVVRLYGSRVRDDARGGDIDLHVTAGAGRAVDLGAEARFSEDLQDLIGDQRIDLILKAPGDALTTFDRVALAESVEL